MSFAGAPLGAFDQEGIMTTDFEARRNSDGSIDMAFYKAHADHLRRSAQDRTVRRLWRSLLSLRLPDAANSGIVRSKPHLTA